MPKFNAVFIILPLFIPYFLIAQPKQGQSRLDSLLAEMPGMKEDTNAVNLLNAIAFGDTVNTAARMEQHGEPGRINISQSTYELIKNEFPCVRRGKIAAKHKGDVEMYFVATEVRVAETA